MVTLKSKTNTPATVGRPLADYMPAAKHAEEEEDQRRLTFRAQAMKDLAESPARRALEAEKFARDKVGLQLVKDIWPAHPAAGMVHPAKGWPVIIPRPYVATKDSICVKDADGSLHPICNALYWVDRGRGAPDSQEDLRHEPRIACLVNGEWLVTEDIVYFTLPWMRSIPGLTVNPTPVKGALGDGKREQRPCAPYVLSYLRAAFEEVGERPHRDLAVAR